jgi:hypothetical protein
MLRKFICRSANVARRASYQLVAAPQLQAGLYLPVFNAVAVKFLVAAGFPALRARKVAAGKNGLLDAVRGDIPSSIRPYPYGNSIFATVATVKRKAAST